MLLTKGLFKHPLSGASSIYFLLISIAPIAPMASTYNPKEDTNCPVSILVSLLSGPWTLYILWVLFSKSPIRFGALHREIKGISTKVLTERLRMLEAEEIIYRNYQPSIPPEVTYGLTTRGQELMGVIEQIDALAQRWYGRQQSRV